MARSFDDIREDVNKARALDNSDLLLECADELEAFGSEVARGLALDCRASVLKIDGDYKGALDLYDQAMDIYEEIDDTRGMASAQGSVTNIYRRTGNLDEAILSADRALALYTDLDDLHGMVGSNGTLGIVHYQRGDTPKSIEHLRRAVSLSEGLTGHHRTSRSACLANLGGVYKYIGDYPAAIDHLMQARSLNEELGFDSGYGSTTITISQVYSDLGDHENSLSYANEALEVFTRIDNKDGIGYAKTQLAFLLSGKGEYDKAHDIFLETRDLFEELGFRTEIEVAVTNIAHALVKREQYEEAEAFIDAEFQGETESVIQQIARDICVAELYSKTDRVNLAREKLTDALELAENSGFPQSIVDVHKALRELALVENDLVSYVKHNDEFTRLTEEINGKETAAKLALQEKQRELDVKDAEVAKQLAVLYSTLPRDIANRVAKGEKVNDQHQSAVVVFLDIVGFTLHTSNYDPQQTTKLLDEAFDRFDVICDEYGVTKIKTIGDSYMAVSFSDGQEEMYLENAARVAISMHDAGLIWPDGSPLQYRIGIHCGPVVAGVIGSHRLQYDVWGDTVNVASRMESSGEPGKIQVSESFATELLKQSDTPFNLEERGMVDIKGKGALKTYWLNRG